MKKRQSFKFASHYISLLSRQQVASLSIVSAKIAVFKLSCKAKLVVYSGTFLPPISLNDFNLAARCVESVL
jgi:hypothetical protein